MPQFANADSYIYFYHLKDERGNGIYMMLPSVPERISETLGVSFSSTSPLSRTAPIFSYNYSGPRSVNISLQLHRDMMYSINDGVSNDELELGEDYIDSLINHLQAMALPKYTTSNKLIDPPMVAVKLGEQLFIKGVVTGSVTTEYMPPILTNNKYAQISVSFTVSEVDPYDAESVITQGSLRGISTSLVRSEYK